MRIASTQYTLSSKTLEIYVAGCKANPHCEDCHNSEIWDFNNGEILDDAYYKKIESKINKFNDIIDNIWILGGEPLDQDIKELIKLCIFLKTFGKKIWLFTRFDLDEVPKDVIKYFDYVKTGRYLPKYKPKTDNSHKEYGVVLATTNQHIYKRGKDY